MIYAAYGSNLHPLRLQNRIGEVKLLGISSLEGWEVHFNKLSKKDGSGKCNIIKKSSTIYVALYKVSKTQKLELDRIEGLGKGYDEIHLNGDAGNTYFTYSANKNWISDSLRPFSWYTNLVLVGACFWNFPRHYIDYISNTVSDDDLDAIRHANNMNIVNECKLYNRANNR